LNLLVSSDEIKSLTDENPTFFQKSLMRKAYLRNSAGQNNNTLSNSSSSGLISNSTSSIQSCPSSVSTCSSISSNSSSSFDCKRSIIPLMSMSIPLRRQITSSVLSPPSIPSSSSCPCSCTSKSSNPKVEPCIPPIVPSPPQKDCIPNNPINPWDIISGKLTPQSVDSDGTEACITDFKATNAVGQLGPLSFAITRPPYKISSCDQVVIVNGETFSNPRDYSKREKAWFTLSVYMVNSFSFDAAGKRDSQNLRNHMLIQEITSMPMEIIGAPGCLEFFDSKNMNRIVACFDEATQKLIKATYMDLMKCRIGDDLKNLNSDQLAELIRTSCMGNDLKFRDSRRLMNFLKTNNLMPQTQYQVEQANNSLMEKLGINPAYGLQVPGSA
jgi:hypothetical protein